MSKAEVGALRRVTATLSIFPYTMDDLQAAYKLLAVIGDSFGEDLSDIKLESAQDIETVINCATGMVDTLQSPDD